MKSQTASSKGKTRLTENLKARYADTPSGGNEFLKSLYYFFFPALVVNGLWLTLFLLGIRHNTTFIVLNIIGVNLALLVFFLGAILLQLSKKTENATPVLILLVVLLVLNIIAAFGALSSSLMIIIGNLGAVCLSLLLILRAQ